MKRPIILKYLFSFILFLTVSTLFSDEIPDQIPTTQVPSSKVVLVTGASKGIGKAITTYLAENGYTVYAGLRHLDHPDMVQETTKIGTGRIYYTVLDVTKEADIHATINQIIEKEGHLDVLINNAAVVYFGPAECVAFVEAKQTFEVNYFAPLRLIQAVLPQMRKQNQGLIINISSASGFRPSPGLDIYASSKFALEGLSESLAAYLNRWNVNVVLIEPGPVSTELHLATKMGSRLQGSDNPYASFIEHSYDWMKSRLNMGQPTNEIAMLVKEIIESNEPHLRYQTSKKVEIRAKSKFVDSTGDQQVKQQRELTEELWKSSQVQPR